MPIPSKKTGEDATSFMARCMGNETMKKEYPNNDQRVAICMSKAASDLDAVASAALFCEIHELGWTEDLTPRNLIVPNDEDYVDFSDSPEEISVSSLWENIRRKKKREGKNYRPAKPGDKDRPDPEAFKDAQASEGGMAKAQLKKIAEKAMAIYNMLGEDDEIEAWVQDNISKADLHVESAYDYMMYNKSEEEEEEMESMAAEYQGRKVTLNKPFRTPSGPKKFAVYTKNESGKVVIVRFGDPNMTIKKNNPERRRSFRARHGCDKNPGPKWKSRYWACRAW